MKTILIRFSLLFALVSAFALTADAQKTTKKRTATKRAAVNTKTSKTAKGKTKVKTSGGAATSDPNAAVVVAAPEPPKADSLPIKAVKKSLRTDAAVEMQTLTERSPLAYEHLRGDDAVFRHKIWREIDAREKLNKSFTYSADADNGNQRFISILFKAIQDSAVTVFSNVDDRFTTPMTIADIKKEMALQISITSYDSLGNPTTKIVDRDIDLDSFYKFRIKEEVIFDKESSRLFWRILGIAPLMKVIDVNTGDYKGEKELFWVYYPDMRPILAKYDVYNPKNSNQSMSWEDLFESRMFYGRIIKSTFDNPNDLKIAKMPGLRDNQLFQLFEGERISETIFNYEQDQWAY